MILSDRDIKRWLAGGGGLVITPAPADHQIQPASVDVHLDLARGAKRPICLALGDEIVVGPEGITGAEWADDPCTRGLRLAPGECALVVTRERVVIPPHLSIQVDGRSSIGRLFLTIHQTAGWCDAGFGVAQAAAGGCPIVLELVNHSPRTIRLLDGARIGQLKVVRLSTQADRPYGSAELGSHYADQQDVRPPAQLGEGG